MITEIDFKVTGEERKKLAYAIGETLGLPVKYTRTPRFDYMIGESTDRNIDHQGTTDGEWLCQGKDRRCNYRSSLQRLV